MDFMCFCCLLMPGFSMDIQCHILPHTFSMLAHHHIRHQTRNKMGLQPGDCRWLFQSC